MVWTDPTFIVGAIACVAAVVAAFYTYLPYRAKRRGESRSQFVDERRYLTEHRADLTAIALAQRKTFVQPRLARMLSQPEWIPSKLIPLANISIKLDWGASRPSADGELMRVARKMLPWAGFSNRFRSYSSALGGLARPGLFQDLPCYRLLAAHLNQDPAEIHVGMTTFFSGIDESEALAHEFARSFKAGDGLLRRSASRRFPIRFVVDKLAARERSIIFSVSALTLRVEDSTATFFLHSRDPTAVAIAGSLLHLAPSGVFQPTSEDRDTVVRDCSPWLTLCREYAEEFLGVEEAQGAAGVALSYTHDQPYAAINEAYLNGSFRVFVCGLGLDPLTYCPELVSIACVDAEVFDTLFEDLVVRNSEGFLRGKEMRSGRVVGYDFSHSTVNNLLDSGRLSPAAYAALSRAWEERSELSIS